MYIHTSTMLGDADEVQERTREAHREYRPHKTEPASAACATAGKAGVPLVGSFGTHN